MGRLFLLYSVGIDGVQCIADRAGYAGTIFNGFKIAVVAKYIADLGEIDGVSVIGKGDRLCYNFVGRYPFSGFAGIGLAEIFSIMQGQYTVVESVVAGVVSVSKAICAPVTIPTTENVMEVGECAVGR